MIRITVRRDSEGEIYALECSGHAAFHNEDGGDIVCAGVSALMGSLALGLQKVVGVEDISLRENDGLMSLCLPSQLSESQASGSRVLLQTTFLALQEMAHFYKGFVKIEQKRSKMRY